MSLLILIHALVCLMLTANMSCHNHLRLMMVRCSRDLNNVVLMSRVTIMTDICCILITVVTCLALVAIYLGHNYMGGLCGYLSITFMTLAVTVSTRVACKITKGVVGGPFVYDLFLLGFIILYTGLLIATSKGF